MLEGWSVNAIVTLQTGLPWTPSDTTSVDWLGTGENSNTAIPDRRRPVLELQRAPSAFSNTGQHPIPCYGVLGGCTPFASAPAATLGGLPELRAGSLRWQRAASGTWPSLHSQMPLATCKTEAF